MRVKFVTNVGRLLAGISMLLLASNCSEKPSKVERLIGVPVVERRLEEGFRFYRQYLVYSRKDEGDIKLFDTICSKIAAKFEGNDGFDAGAIVFEAGRSGFKPILREGAFSEIYITGMTRAYELNSKDNLSGIRVFESPEYVCVIVFRGS